MMSKFIAKKVYDVQPIEEFTDAYKREEIITTIKQISTIHNIKIPEIYFYNSEELNAFATWATKNSSMVAFSSTLLHEMNIEEIKWVAAHEMGHIISWDMVTSTLLQWVLNSIIIYISHTIVNAISDNAIVRFICLFVFQIILWFFAQIIIAAFSRFREYGADRFSAQNVWTDSMIKALEFLKRKEEYNLQTIALLNEANPERQKLQNFWITWWKWFLSLFASHPDLEDRISALRNV